MRALLPLTHSALETIQNRIKSGADCSELLDPYDIKGADLAGIRCERFDRSGQDLEGANLSGAWLPNAKLMNANCRNCNFSGANLERSDGSHGDFRGANMANIFAPFAIWRYADLRDATLNGAVIRFACEESYGARFTKGFFELLMKHWKVEGWNA